MMTFEQAVRMAQRIAHLSGRRKRVRKIGDYWYVTGGRRHA